MHSFTLLSAFADPPVLVVALLITLLILIYPLLLKPSKKLGRKRILLKIKRTRCLSSSTC